MRLFFILLIALFSSHSYSFSLDLETITDTLEQVSEELSENAKKEETREQEEEEKRLAKEKKLADAKAAKEKKLADAKALEEYKKSPEGIKKEKERVKKEKEKTARLKKEKKERLRIEKENEGKHFFVRILCRNIKETVMYSEKDIKVYSTVGQLNSEDLYYVNEMYPKKACECYVKETKKALGPERIKKVNALYKKDKKADGLMTSREQLFFNGLPTKNCALKKKLDFWIKGGRP
jgi:hypothetical protein